MIKVKSLKVLSLVTVMSLSLAIPVFASDSELYDRVNNRPPVEEFKDGKKYIDGIQLLTEKDMEDIKEKNTEPKTVPNPGDIGVMGIFSWTKVAEANYYTSANSDRYNNTAASAVKRTLSTTSEFTISTSGDTSFNFFNSLVQAKLSNTIGYKYSKTLTEEYTIPAGWVYEQKTAIKVLQEDYRYTVPGVIWDDQYAASSFDYKGLETWLWSNPIN